jgi:nucleoside-diphosphate-sugar epimerase
MMRKSSILITGAGGEVGSELIKILSNNENINIVTLDLHPLEPSIADMVSNQITGNILDKNLIDQINLEFEIKEVYHLAAILSTRSEISPNIAHDVNINGTINFLELALKQSKSQKNRVKFFFPSSIAVYGVEKNSKQLCKEYEAQNPITIYGANKLYAEKLGLYYSHYYSQLSDNKDFIDFRSLRFPGLISARTIPSGGTSDFIPEMWHHIKNHDLYECFVSENAQIPFLAMPDAIKAIQKLMNSDCSEIQSRIYNVKAFNPSALEFFNLIKTHYSDAKIVYSINAQRQKIVDSWPSDIDDSLAKKEWGWSPNYNLQRTINEYLLS